MKKLLVLVLGLFFGLGLASCSGTIDSLNINQLSSKQSLATLSYLSSGFLSFEEDQSLATPTNLSLESEGTVTSEELDEINEYFSLLKTFIEDGPENIATVNEQASDRPEYDYLMDISVQGQEMLLYYNVDLLSREISGILVMGDVEYQITAQSTLDDFEDFDDDDDEEDDEDEFETEEPNEEQTTDPITEEETSEEETTEEAPTTEAPTTEEATTEEATTEEETTEEQTTSNNSTPLSMREIDDEDDDDDEDDEDENEIKKEMTLIARNGDDTITITYEFKSEDDEEKTEFTVLKNIGGIEEELEVEIKIEEDEYKLEIRDGNDVYEFKMESEDNGEVEYKLEYVIDGEEGEIEILETTDELGNKVYQYEYEVEGERQEYEKEDAFDDDDEDDDEDNEDDEDDDDEDDEDDLEDDDDEDDEDEETSELSI